jgi:hypothetical protein
LPPEVLDSQLPNYQLTQLPNSSFRPIGNKDVGLMWFLAVAIRCPHQFFSV